ncbi:DUF4097 family beta strand repeat-containing protein [Acrocarpospora catenulata]|uniref:DUF4097 family beta strand repeat-containing protein n=1 Tax=Acrocarpospora catenulata TaxID=2836182 RepID=UPI001BDA75DC|nr:DUF4097 family beta strand repeat-containing protein [Acrocarpospora catenulata]
MARWTIEEPGELTFGQVTGLSVRIVAGRLAVLAGDGPPTLEVAEAGGTPLHVEHDEETGHLTVAYHDLTWDGVLGWLRPGNRRTVLTLTVPKNCPVQAGVISASTVLAGLEGRTGVRSVSGDITLDGVSGEVHAETISGSVESRGLSGDLSFSSVSGELTVADGAPRRLKAQTVTGRIMADLELSPTGHVTFISVSGTVLVRLPADVRTDVTLQSTSGAVEAEFPELTARDRPGGRSLSGRLGGGMASLSATTVSGEITLFRKDVSTETHEETEAHA